MIKVSTKGVENLRLSTREGLRTQELAIGFLKRIKNEKDVLEVLRRVGFYDEQGKPNPYFFQQTGKARARGKG